jgi:hypothetical protein
LSLGFLCVSQRYFDLRNEVMGVWINHVMMSFMKLPKCNGVVISREMRWA